MNVPGAEAAAQRYLSANARISPYGARSVAISHAPSGIRTVAARDLAEILAACATPRTLAEHAAFVRGYVRLSPDTPRDDLQRILTSLAQTGLLLSEQALIARCQAEASGLGSGCKLGHIVVPTAGRPGVLERCLTSIAGQLAHYGHDDVRVTVLDDSRGPAETKACRATVERVASQFPIRLARVSVARAARELTQTVARLTSTPKAVVESALCGAPECRRHLGAVRNLALLLAPGGLLLLDDDIEFRAYLPPDTVRGLRLIPTAEPSPARCFRSSAEALHGLAEAQLDLRASVEEFLGREVAECVAEYQAQSVHVTALDQRIERALTGQGGTVLRVSPGLVGDSGSENPGFFFANPAAFPDVFATEQAYRETVESRMVQRHTPAPAISTTTTLLGGNVVLDNRGILPPFFPVERASDYLFGRLLDAVRQDGLSAHLPWATPHWPETPRRAKFEQIWERLSGVDIANVLDLAMEELPSLPQSSSPERRLVRYGQHLQDFARQPVRDFEETLRQHALSAGHSQVASIESRLARANELPDFFAADLRQYLKIVLQSQTREDYLVPRDLSEAAGPQRARELSRELVESFGALMSAWPAIDKQAKEHGNEWWESLAE